MSTQIRYWGIGAIALMLLLYLLSDVILPFLLGGALAYVLDPLADRLQRAGLSRAIATTIIMLVGALFFVVFMLLVIPTLINQAIGLVQTAPDLFARLQAFVVERFPELLDQNSTLRSSLDQIGELIKSKGGEFVQTVVTSAAGLVNTVVLIVLVPVITFYLLLDWDRMIARIDSLLPREHAPTLRRLAAEIDLTLASFIRGQGLVCLILGTYYALALAVVGLNFGMIIGAVAGALTFIPYVGALVGGALALGMALYQFWGEWWLILIVYAIFQSGQMVEGNILTPKLVGESVGLHPVWLLFALSAFGALFGFVGLLVAVPVAAMIGVISRFLIDRYRSSALYTGASEPNALTEAPPTELIRGKKLPDASE